MDKGYSEAIQEGMKLLKLTRAWEDANWSKKVMDSLTPNSMSELYVWHLLLWQFGKRKFSYFADEDVDCYRLFFFEKS